MNKRKGKIMLNQARAVDKSRLDTKVGKLSTSTMHLVDEALKIVFCLN